MMYESTASPARVLFTTSSGGVAEQRVVLGDEAQLAGGQRLHGALGAVDRGDLDVLAGRQAGLLDGERGTEAHLVVLCEDDAGCRCRWP